MGFLYKMLKYQMNMYEIREVMAVFGFVQSLGFCTEFWDKLEHKRTFSHRNIMEVNRNKKSRNVSQNLLSIVQEAVLGRLWKSYRNG